MCCPPAVLNCTMPASTTLPVGRAVQRRGPGVAVPVPRRRRDRGTGPVLPHPLAGHPQPGVGLPAGDGPGCARLSCSSSCFCFLVACSAAAARRLAGDSWVARAPPARRPAHLPLRCLRPQTPSLAPVRWSACGPPQTTATTPATRATGESRAVPPPPAPRRPVPPPCANTRPSTGAAAVLRPACRRLPLLGAGSRPPIAVSLPRRSALLEAVQVAGGPRHLLDAAGYG